MNDAIPIYALFSIVALIAKLAIAWRGRHEIRSSNSWFLTFFLALFGINGLELIGFYYPTQGIFAPFLMALYYESVLIMGLSFLAIALDVTGTMNQKRRRGILAGVLCGSLAIFWPGATLEGVTSIGYTSTRIAGPLYWFFQILLLGSLSGSLGILGYHTKYNAKIIIRRKAKALLISISPIFVAAVLVIALMQSGVEVTGSVFGSVAVLIFLYVFIVTNDDHRTFKFLSCVPATSEFIFVSRMRDLICTLESANLQCVVSKFENALISEALAKSNGNKTVAADMLGISRTTLRRKMGIRAG